MVLRFTKHALERMRERGVTEADVHRALSAPDRLESSTRTQSRLLAKKLIRKESGKRILLVIHEMRGLETIIITVIDSSKIDKYY